MTAWTLFYNPVLLSSGAVLYLVLPLLAAVAVIYKTIRTKNIRRLWLEILGLILYMYAGLAALCAALWLLMRYWK